MYRCILAFIYVNLFIYSVIIRHERQSANPCNVRKFLNVSFVEISLDLPSNLYYFSNHLIKSLLFYRFSYQFVHLFIIYLLLQT